MCESFLLCCFRRGGNGRPPIKKGKRRRLEAVMDCSLSFPPRRERVGVRVSCVSPRPARRRGSGCECVFSEARTSAHRQRDFTYLTMMMSYFVRKVRLCGCCVRCGRRTAQFFRGFAQ